MTPVDSLLCIVVLTGSDGSVHQELVTSTTSKKAGTGSLWHQPSSLVYLSDIDDGYSTGRLSTFTSNVSTTSSGEEFHPEHGVLPPSPPPTSTQEDNFPSEPGGNVHPTYGLFPSPPTINQIEVPRKKGFHPHLIPHPPLIPLANIDKKVKLNEQSKVDTPPTTSDAIELEILQKAFEKLKFEKKQLELKYDEAILLVHALQRENDRLQEHLYQLQQHQHQRQRPSNLYFHPATAGGQSHPSSDYYYSRGPDSLTPPTGQGAQSTSNPPPKSSGPGPVGEKDLLPRNAESADSSRSDSVSSQKSQDWKQLI